MPTVWVKYLRACYSHFYPPLGLILEGRLKFKLHFRDMI